MATKIVTPKITLPGERTPIVHWLILLVILGCAGAGWWYKDRLLAMIPPGMLPDPMVPELQQTAVRQQARIVELEEEVQRLRQENANIQTGDQVNQEAVKRVREEVKKAQDERLALQEEIAFLRGLISEGNGKGGIWVRDLQLRQGEDAEVFRYRFTVSAVGKEQDGVNVSGAVSIGVDGKLNGESKSLTLKALSNEKVETLKMQFRHFQDFDGELHLPKGFEPSAVVIEAKPEKEDGLQPASRRFDWLITGEG